MHPGRCIPVGSVGRPELCQSHTYGKDSPLMAASPSQKVQPPLGKRAPRGGNVPGSKSAHAGAGAECKKAPHRATSKTQHHAVRLTTGVAGSTAHRPRAPRSSLENRMRKRFTPSTL